MKSLKLITEKLKLSANYMSWLKPIFIKYKGSPWKDMKVSAEEYSDASLIVDIYLMGFFRLQVLLMII